MDPRVSTSKGKTNSPAVNSCAAFGAQRPSSCSRQCKLLSEIFCSISISSSMTHNTTPLSDYHMSPTPWTSLPNSTAGSKKKKAKSDILQEVDHIWDKIESMHSDAKSHHNSKHQHFLVKFNMKSKHNRDSKKYEWLHSSCKYEASQAAVSHQHLQEK
jgi:hypothetical protein